MAAKPSLSSAFPVDDEEGFSFKRISSSTKYSAACIAFVQNRYFK